MEDFKELLPAFSAFTEKRGIAPKVQFFEGIPGIIDIYHNILNSQVDICSFLGTADFPPQIQKYLKTIFFPTKLEK
ncbi:MAG: hypothetical protein LBU27_03380 [Candidatus Peribacteria bacterium]|jgi:hypothetical protein|nr:hypothetical protein [Candidatus Peribacteria bacterium]